jgi:hypothetical protein
MTAFDVAQRVLLATELLVLGGTVIGILLSLKA